MKVIFFGTSLFAANILAFLKKEEIEILAVVTRPDRPKGRSLHLTPPPVKVRAAEIDASLPIYQPEKVSTVEFEEILKKHNADLFIVVAFGEIIKQNILSIPRLTCINIHTSLLPSYRGAAPIQRCLMNGDLETGVSIIEMTSKMDAGDILHEVRVKIESSWNFGELEKHLCGLACHAVLKVIHDFENKCVVRRAQDENLITYAPKIAADEQQIDWDRPAISIHNLVRALSPIPGAWSFVWIRGEKKRLKIKRTAVVEKKNESPGAIADSAESHLIVACKEGALDLIEVQLEGKKPMAAKDFLKGVRHEISFDSFK